MTFALLSASLPAQDEKKEKDAAKERVERAEALRLADAWLDAQQAYQHLPSLTAGVVVGDDLIWSRGYGTVDEQHSIAATPETIYSICSISKLFTSVALMQQWEARRVRLDEPIVSYLPWAALKASKQDSVPITLRGALSHSAGLPRESDYPYWAPPDFAFPTDDQIKAKIAEQPPLFPAERYYQYSNLGLTLAGDVVAQVSGETYSQYAQKHVLEPLGLKDTRTWFPLELYGKSMAIGYGAIKRDGTREKLKPFDTKGITPAAGYTSNVKDLAKFASWQFQLLRNDQENVLKSSTLREMQRVQFIDPGWKATYGLGFSVLHRDKDTFVGHEGSCPGYSTSLRMRNADETAVIIMIAAPADAQGAGIHIFGILDKRKGFSFKEPAPVKDVNLEDYAGHYSNQPWGAESVIVPWAGGLALLGLPASEPAANLVLLKTKSKDVFRRVREDGSEAEEFTFQRGPDGKVVGWTHFSNPTRKINDLPPAPAKP